MYQLAVALVDQAAAAQARAAPARTREWLEKP